MVRSRGPERLLRPHVRQLDGDVVPGRVLVFAFGYLLGPAGLLGTPYTAPVAELHLGFPTPTLDFLKGFLPALTYLPLAAPFALLTVVGGINVTESARVAGDDYPTRDILLTEAVATLVAGLCGGVAQSIPYIGQPAYKQMGARAGYTLLTGLFIGLGGVLGYVSFIVELIPRAMLAPILIFVALDIAWCTPRARTATSTRRGAWPASSSGRCRTSSRWASSPWRGCCSCCR
jgi:AGZA family xanthine/uracil permease-like MFS transporter